MIISHDYPHLKVKFEGQKEETKVYVDTGFEGFLFLPEEYKNILGEPDTHTEIILAGGKREWTPLYVNRRIKVYGMSMDGKTRETDEIKEIGHVICHGKGSYLIGRKFLDKFEVYLRKSIEMIIEM